MDTTANKQLMINVFDAMAHGDRKPFRDCMADDVNWIFKGSTKWKGVYRGKESVLRDLMVPLFAQFADEYTSNAVRVMADGEFVVVEAEGRVNTKTGMPYHNRYCYVFRIREGKVVEITEYMDTALADAVLADPH